MCEGEYSNIKITTPIDRITVGGKTKFVCVDGPEFDAHQVDFDEMIMRLGAYKDIEKK